MDRPGIQSGPGDSQARQPGHHVPVPDFGVPGPASEARWRYASTRLRRTLAAGGAVALQCHGRIGHTGTFTARLLIEARADPGEAVELVRASRPGAIETAEVGR